MHVIAMKYHNSLNFLETITPDVTIIFSKLYLIISDWTGRSGSYVIIEHVLSVFKEIM